MSNPALIPLPTEVETSSAFRKAIATSIASGLDSSWLVLAADRPINRITRKTVFLERTLIAPGKAMGLKNSTYVLVAISPQSIAETKEDFLDDLVDDLTGVLDDLKIFWSTAERAVWNDTNPAYKITFIAQNARRKS